MTTPETPASLGFRMPAEWAPHEATWLSWPHKVESWPGKFEPIPRTFGEMVAALHEGEEVRILVGSDELEAAARVVLARRRVEHGNVRFFRVPTDDAWVRDHGPNFVLGPNGELALNDWGYNAWGGKYPPWDQDDRVPGRIAARMGYRRFEPGMILEGGSIEVNGRGTVITTEQCLLNPNRNPSLSKDEIERRLRDHLGVTNVLWLGQGIEGDDTDGHVDDLTRFVGPRTVVTVVEDDPADPNHRPLQENLARLRALRDETGSPLEVVTLPMPDPIHHEGTRLPASYANFYVGNAAVLVPVFGDAKDAEACATLSALFPGRRLAPIRAEDLVWGLGAFHCLTQQQPKSG